MIKVYADTETTSEEDLRAAGTHRYAEHPSTRIQLFSYAFDDATVNLWAKEEGEPMPGDLKDAFRDPECIFYFHNAFFDRLNIEHDLKIVLPIQRYRCVMAQALSHGLPGALDKLGEAVGLPEDKRKHAAGKRLVQLFCKPKKQKDGTLKWATPETHPEQWAQYKDYCKQDTASMRDVAKRIPRWNYPGQQTELELWYIDQICNSRGMAIDLELVEAAMSFIAKEKGNLAKRTEKMTNGEVQAASQRDAMLRHIVSQYGFELDDMRKATIEKIVADEEYPAELRELLEVRLDTCTTSTAKYKKIQAMTSADGRVRGSIQFAGASRTLRDGGRGIQPQNFTRPVLKHPVIMQGIDALKTDVADIIGFDIMKLTSSALRYTIVPAEGKKFCVSDLSNIEGRVLAYLAGEEWKLQAFRDFDAGIGPDIYKAAYGKAFGVDPESIGDDSVERQVGKVMELAFGFAGGAPAFLNFAVVYNLDLNDLANKTIPNLPKDVATGAENYYEYLKKKDRKAAENRAVKAGDGILSWGDYYTENSTYGLPKNQFIAFESLKKLWRQSHPATVKFWGDLETAVRQAIATPDKDFYCGRICVRRTKVWVRVILPSGHNLCYPRMKIATGDEYNVPARKTGESDQEFEKRKIKMKPGSMIFKGVDKKWQWIETFYGKLCENSVQAFARDIFKFGQLNAEKEDYAVVLPVHDELVTEVPDTPEYSVKRLSEIMSANPPWARDIPLAAKGFEDYRYHK